MPEIAMPVGTYLSLNSSIRAGKGGQTRAVLMRNRLLAQAGVEPTLLTVDDSPTYPEIRAVLGREGQFVAPMRLLNIFEWYRTYDVEGRDVIGDVLPSLGALEARDEFHPDHTAHVTRYVQPDGDEVRDYRRPDGSVFLRMYDGPPGTDDPSQVLLVNSVGEPVASWGSKGGWYRQWLFDLAPAIGKTFIISDNRTVLGHALPIVDPRFHIMHLMHNTHMVGKRRWNSKLAPTYVPLLNSIQQLDGLVSLTARQREDVGFRFGRTNNLFVVPNPVESTPPPHPMPRRAAMRFAVVSRLHRKKRLEHAIRAIALVVQQEPAATLDIHGDGEELETLRSEVNSLGLQDVVTFRGYDPQARDALWGATAFLMTSIFEGYPLATLESMSHGCPVISYDIKYGPREQITHGIDGFLVEPGDIRGMADRCLELIRNPELVAKMSEAAFAKALQHDDSTFLNDWRLVLEAVIDNKSRRTTLESVDLDVRRLCRTGAGRLSGLPGIGRLARGRSRAGNVQFDGALTVRGRSEAATLDSAVVTLDAICDETDVIVGIPLLETRSGETFQVSTDFDPVKTLAPFDRMRTVHFRLRVVWQNSSWETVLTQPGRPSKPFAVPAVGS